jgi:type II secretory pathway component PulF
VNARQRVVLYTQLGRLLGAGVALRGALEMLARHEGPAYAPAARAALEGVDRGKGLSEALRDSGLGLPDLHLELIAVGEHSGRLPEILEQLRRWDEEGRKLRFEVVQPMGYPCVLLLAAIFVAPIQSLVSDGTGAYVHAVLVPLVPVVALVAALWLAWRHGLGQVVLRLPVVGTGPRLLAGSSFLYALGTALESGLGLPESLAGAARCSRLAGLRSFGERLQVRALAGDLRPEDLASPEHFGVYGSQVLAAAAETGEWGAAARNTAQMLRDEGLAATRRAIGLGAGALYLCAAALVAVTVVRFYTRLYSMSGL